MYLRTRRKGRKTTDELANLSLSKSETLFIFLRFSDVKIGRKGKQCDEQKLADVFCFR
jgi:hypothetical protein